MAPGKDTSSGERLQALARREGRGLRRHLTMQRDVHVSVHEGRKAIRRLRAILALVAGRIEGTAIADRALDRLGDGSPGTIGSSKLFHNRP